MLKSNSKYVIKKTTDNSRLVKDTEPSNLWWPAIYRNVNCKTQQTNQRQFSKSLLWIWVSFDYKALLQKWHKPRFWLSLVGRQAGNRDLLWG